MWNTSMHPMDSQWEAMAKAHYREAYPELLQVFRQILGRAFLRTHWIPDPLALDYLTKILIRFLPVSIGKDSIDQALAEQESANPGDPRDIIRFYESAGEIILWWSGMYRKKVFQAEGKRSYTIAYEHLSDMEVPTQRCIVMPGQEQKMASKRLKVNKMFSEQFENYQEVLQKSSIIDDPSFNRYRDMFMTDDFSIN